MISRFHNRRRRRRVMLAAASESLDEDGHAPDQGSDDRKAPPNPDLQPGGSRGPEQRGTPLIPGGHGPDRR